MKKMFADYHNLANVFIPVTDIEGHFVDILDRIRDSIFGVELQLTSEGANTYMIAPSFVDTAEEPVLRFRDCPTEDFSFYEGYLSESFFFPLKPNKNGLFIQDMCELALQADEEVYVQWLLRRRYGLRDRAVDMYDSYLQGNDKPAWSALGRKVQDKAGRLFEKLQPDPPMLRPYVEEAEEKIQSEGFQFQLRIAIKSNRINDVLDYIRYSLEDYTATNTLKIRKSVDKKVAPLFTDCVLAVYTKENILSLKLFSEYDL